MLRILRADEEVEIDEAAFRRRNVEPEFHVREDQLSAGQTAGRLVPQHLLVSIGHVVVRDRDGLDDGRGLLKRGQIIAPSIRAAELIVHDRAWRVDMRFPSPPF